MMVSMSNAHSTGNAIVGRVTVNGHDITIERLADGSWCAIDTHTDDLGEVANLIATAPVGEYIKVEQAARRRVAAVAP